VQMQIIRRGVSFFSPALSFGARASSSGKARVTPAALRKVRLAEVGTFMGIFLGRNVD